MLPFEMLATLLLVSGGPHGAAARGALPSPGAPSRAPIVCVDHESDASLDQRAEARGYLAKLRAIAQKHFGRRRVPAIRAEGLALLREFIDPAAFKPMIQTMRSEGDDVRLAIVDHLAGQGEAGQGALAWLATHESDPTWCYEASSRIISPAAPAVLGVLDFALRSPNADVANSAGALAGILGAVELLPQMILAQVAVGGSTLPPGDLAWIAIGTQTGYIADLVPVVGSNSGAFQPVPGVINEGSLLRVVDAVVVSYRTEIHNSLVAMSTRNWGQSTAGFGYDTDQWVAWYNAQYVPFKREQALKAKLLEGAPPERI